MQIDPVQVLLGMQAILLVLLGFLAQSWMARVDKKIDMMVSEAAFTQRCERIDEDIQELCDKNAIAHKDLWTRTNTHRHVASCSKTDGRCEVVVGSVVIAEGGAS
jgi:hypothetical protein